MRIGPMDKRVELQAFASISDGMGGSVSTWTTQDTVNAAIWPRSAKEILRGTAPVMTATHQIQIRFHPDLKATWRVKYGNRYFSIDSIINKDERDVQMDLLCTEVVS